MSRSGFVYMDNNDNNNDTTCSQQTANLHEMHICKVPQCDQEVSNSVSDFPCVCTSAWLAVYACVCRFANKHMCSATLHETILYDTRICTPSSCIIHTYSKCCWIYNMYTEWTCHLAMHSVAYYAKHFLSSQHIHVHCI